MAQDQFNVQISMKTLAKMVDNILVDNLPNKKLMVNFMTRIISKGYNGNDFFMALTDTFPRINYRCGDVVRIKRSSVYYGINDQRSAEEGYIVGDGIYVRITNLDYTCATCYTGTVTYIDTGDNVCTRELDFSNDVILMDNTVKITRPELLPADLI